MEENVWGLLRNQQSLSSFTLISKFNEKQMFQFLWSHIFRKTEMCPLGWQFHNKLWNPSGRANPTDNAEADADLGCAPWLFLYSKKINLLVMPPPATCQTGQLQSPTSTVSHNQSPVDNIRRYALLMFKQAFCKITFHRCSEHKKRKWNLLEYQQCKYVTGISKLRDF